MNSKSQVLDHTVHIGCILYKLFMQYRQKLGQNYLNYTYVLQLTINCMYTCVYMTLNTQYVNDYRKDLCFNTS